MRKTWIKGICILLVLTGLLAGCSGERRKPNTEVTVPLSDKPILPVTKETVGDLHTPVYATVFGDTVILAAYPVEEWETFEEPECPAREISQGGRILCGGEHEQEVPITKVMILEALAPDSTREWFSGMTELYLIEGIEKLDVRFVTDMTDMFRDCYLMTDLPSWYLHHEGAA